MRTLEAPRAPGRTYRTMESALYHARVNPEKRVLYVTTSEALAEYLRDVWKEQLASLPNMTISSLEMTLKQRKKAQ